MHYEGEITEDHTVGDTDGRWLGVNGDEDASVFYERRLSDIEEGTYYYFSARAIDTHPATLRSVMQNLHNRSIRCSTVCTCLR